MNEEDLQLTDDDIVLDEDFIFEQDDDIETQVIFEERQEGFSSRFQLDSYCFPDWD